ncbi:unnamed protein product [Larinioides sclopetarius]|uniref:Uncharacterized protein n=1 Tax=Larinioides sclopetarius TaxID=280406 RepID=A0AAV2BUW6_9ARAC
MDKINLFENTSDLGIETENIVQNSDISLPHSVASSSIQVQKGRKKHKKVSEDKLQSLAYKIQREKGNARNRKYFEKMTDAQREERNRKRREAYQKKKDLNLVKSINDLTPGQQQKQRKYWRKTSVNYRKRKQQLKDVVTPRSQINFEPSYREHLEACDVSGDTQLTPLSSQKKRGEKVCVKNRARMLKEIQDKHQSLAYKIQREKDNARNRKYFAKMTDAQREERNRKRREAYQKKKDLNLVKSINDLTPGQQQKQRKYWRETSVKYRKRKQQLKDVGTPRSQIKHSEACVVSGDTQLTPLSSQKKRGEKVRAKNRARMLKEIQEKNKKIVELQRKVKSLQILHLLAKIHLPQTEK